MSEKPALSPSQYYMWLCLLSIAWEDGGCDEKEVDYFSKVFENLSNDYALTQEQRDGLANALEKESAEPEAYFHKITDHEAREALVMYAHDLIQLDGRDPDTDAIIKRLKMWEHPDSDNKKLRAEVHAVVSKDRQQRDHDERVTRGQLEVNPFFKATDKLLGLLGIDATDLFD